MQSRPGVRPCSPFASTASPSPAGVTGSATTEPPAGPAPEQVALAGRDGLKAEQLLDNAKREGAAVLADVTRRALKRWLAHDPQALLSAQVLFTNDERQDVANALAATNATAELLGRSKVRLRQQRAEALQGTQAFSSEATDFHVFDDSGGLSPLAPLRALAYFRKLVPSLALVPERFGQLLQRRAFTLAVDTDAVLLDKVKQILADRLATGRSLGAAPRDIQDLLEGAGIQQTTGGRKAGGAYAENVFRTNMMEAYNTGADEERQEVQDTFPVWRYDGIADGRQRPAHAVHFGKFFASDVPFAKVRDAVAGRFDGFQCRCVAVEVDRWEWAKLQQRGARVETSW